MPSSPLSIALDLVLLTLLFVEFKEEDGYPPNSWGGSFEFENIDWLLLKILGKYKFKQSVTTTH
jgi:hypothetical protein